jgi:hypothetical protein
VQSPRRSIGAAGAGFPLGGGIAGLTWGREIASAAGQVPITTAKPAARKTNPHFFID